MDWARAKAVWDLIEANLPKGYRMAVMIGPALFEGLKFMLVAPCGCHRMRHFRDESDEAILEDLHEVFANLSSCTDGLKDTEFARLQEILL